MSQRVKKPGRSADDSQGKRRRRRPSGSDADEDGTRSGSNSGGNGSLTGMWTPRHLNDLKVSSIYNRNSAEAPAELYRKDLISAMKLPDSEPLTPEEYWLITDSWKQEWEKGVQVPVNPESLPEPEVKLITPVADRSHDFRLPKKKYVRVTHDDFFNPDYHQLVSTAARAEKVCSYDLDDVDAAWLGCSNADRAMQNQTLVSEFLMEQVIEELELQCWEQVQTILKSQEGLGIEYDENVICDVCRSPESEEGNEMVFCDSCNICVHQACYGITTIPSGSWLCRTCTLGIKPTCVLCPNLGGAMKATRSGHTWAHVACAIWIPEVSIGSVEKMEPITKISAIPQSRWSLVCVLCKEKTGACIQCSVKTCKTAYHVTCAFKNGLEMKPIIVDENAEDGIKLRSYCQKHSVNTKKDKPQSGSEEDIEKKKLKAMTAEERNQARAEKLQQIEAEFFKYVRLKDVSQNLAVDMDIVILIYNYWKLKRKSLNNRPLVPPRPETTQLLTQQQEQDLEQMKMFVQLRQDLERVRNLCYMVSRREKLSRSFFRLREQTFQKQLVLLTEKNDLSSDERQAILHANHGPSIYDQFYSHSTAGTTKASLPDYEALMSLIAGVDAKKELLVNGVIKSKKSNKLFEPSTSGAAASTSSKPVASTSAAAASTSSSSQNNANNSNVSTNASSSSSANVNSVSCTERTGANPYKKQFVNGARRRNLLGESGSSHSESETSERAATGGSTAAATAPTTTNKKATAKAAAAAAAAAATKSGGKGAAGNRKPLSYLFDSDSSLDGGAIAAATTPTTTGKKGAATKLKGKVKGKAIVKSTKAVKSTSYLSDSDELELPVVRGGKQSAAAAAGTNKDVPIYSDSESEDAKPNLTTPTTKKETKSGKNAATKEKVTKKTKASAAAAVAATIASAIASKQQAAAAAAAAEVSPDAKPKKVKGEKASPVTAPNTTAPPKGKGKATGKKGKNKGFDPTELIVPQREAAKKATESIRSVKQKSKEQATIDTIEAVVTGSTATVKEESSPPSSKDKTKASTAAPSASIVSTLSDSEPEEKVFKQPVTKKGEKAKSPERKTSGKGAKKGTPAAAATAATEEPASATGDDQDEFDFDDKDEASAKNVSYVPQRQAAKKAAEHIRSGLSNIVAARLIIEDEMELARKKTKLEKGAKGAAGKSPSRKSEDEGGESESRVAALDSSKIETAVAEAAKKVTSKERTPVKGGLGKAGKGSKKEVQQGGEVVVAKAAGAGGGKEARGLRDSDWPFLDKGSQSASRRSREQSSSSSSSGSGSGSSSSSSSNSSSRSSSSSSRSSSAESASPEPSPVTKKASSNQNIASVASKLVAAVAAQDSGPGRKLKTSERCPNRRLRAETPAGEKPPTKDGRPTKSGPGRGDPFRSAFSPSPEPQPAPTHSTEQRSSSPESQSQRHQPNKNSPLSSRNPALRKSNEQQQQSQQRANNKSKSKSPVSAGGKTIPTETPEKKGPRRKGESPKVSAQVDKDSDCETTTTTTTATSKASEKRQTAKALAASRRKSPIKHTGPTLSDESETESAPPTEPSQPVGKVEASKLLSPKSSRSSRNNSQSPARAPSPSTKAVNKRKSNNDGSIVLSDSEESGTEEKENSCVASETQQTVDHHPATPASNKTPKSQKNSTPVPSGFILSPLTPSENKEKEQQQQQSSVASRLSDTEPESKRPRLDPSANSNTTPSSAQQQQSLLAPSTSSSQGGHLKSIFSPPGAGREGEILDFDTELYDLARSVTEDYSHTDDVPSSGSLSFSFSQELFGSEDNKEDSARATLNLVEKLRLQHARKSGIHRPSTESSSDLCDIIEEVKSPTDSEKKVDLSTDRSLEPSAGESIEDKSHNSIFEPPIKCPSSLHTAASPDRSKSIQGDERWVPPSQDQGNSAAAHPTTSLPTSSSSSVSIPNASPSSHKNTFVSIPESSPPVQSHPSRGASREQHGKTGSQPPPCTIPQGPASSEVGSIMDGESDKHHAPTSMMSHQSLTPNSRSLSRSSTDNEKAESLKSQHHNMSGGSLSVETISSPPATSPMVSPMLPGLHPGGRPHPSQSIQSYGPGAAAAEASPNLAGLQLNPFMYPALANNPAFASVMGSIAAAAAAAGQNNPLAPFLHATQVPMPKSSPGLLQGPGSPNFSQNSFASFLSSAVLQAQQQQQHQQNMSAQNQASQGHTPPSSSASSMSGIPVSSSTVHTPTPSPANNSRQRRPSEVFEGKLSHNSPLVSVAASMPPLAKPPLTSPSILLAANMKNVSAPPLQSAVAHIIESVVNNHAGGNAAQNIITGLPKTTLSLDLHLPPSSSSAAGLVPTSTNLPTVENASSSSSSSSAALTPLNIPVVAKQQQSHVDAADFSAVLANKTTENIIPKAGRDSSGDRALVSATTNAASPKASSAGRGRRASTPRAVAIKSEKLSGVNAVIEDMVSPTKGKGRGERKTASSPGRGKGPATPRRSGSGRGKGKGKNLVGVRKDLAGTVYDIDFDEFEENSEEKIDLRALRERRKSSEVHSNAAGDLKHSKSSELTNSSPLPLPVPHVEKPSRRNRNNANNNPVPLKKEKEIERDLDQHHHHHYHPKNSGHTRGAAAAAAAAAAAELQLKEQHHQALQQQQQQQQATHVTKAEISTVTVPTPLASPVEKANIHPILQAPLPGPVDMRTYSSSSTTTCGSGPGVTGEESVIGKIGFPHAKDPSSEIASLFMSSSTGSGGATTVNDLEELDKALEVLVATPKQPTPATTTISQPSQQSEIPGPSIGSTASATTTAPVVTSQPSHSAVNDVISNISSSQLKLQNNTQQPSVMVNNILPGAGYGHVPTAAASKEMDMNTSVNLSGSGLMGTGSTGMTSDASSSISGGDMSRNQLKVKIKGPFLDANYSSTNSIPGGGSSHHSIHQHSQNSSVPSHLAAATGYPPPTSYTPEPSFTPGHHQQWMMSSMVNNTSNLRRMRKKELLRQYWTQDMNMDGGSNSGFPGPSASDMSGLASSSAAHPISRSVITIPKAVASMSIIPTKEDYRLDNPSGNESNDSNGTGSTGFSGPTTLKGALGGAGGTEKKRRSRGIFREMAALGIIPPDHTPRERRRDRAAAASTANTNDSNSRKRARSNKQPSRSTFIPPTLADDGDSQSGKSDKGGMLNTSSIMGSKSSGGNVSSGGSAVSAVVNVVNHPTPKLKIKFGDMSNPSNNSNNQSSSSNSISAAINTTNHLTDSDKETPNKKAKGRPPKKRGLPEAAAPPTMEELKKVHMKYREMIMQEYAMTEQQEILKLSGTRRSKKHKRKAGQSAGSETDDGSVRSKSPGPEVTVIDGPKPKLILRLGKGRSLTASSDTSASANSGEGGGGGGGSGAGGSSSSSSSSNNNKNNTGGGGAKLNENGLPGGQSDNSSQGPNNHDSVENDSGFTGSSEGSSGSSLHEPLANNSNGSTKTKESSSNSSSGSGSNKDKSVNNTSGSNNNNNNNNSKNSSGAASTTSSSGGNSSTNCFRNGGGGGNGGKVLVLELNKVDCPQASSNLSTTSSTTSSSNLPFKGKNTVTPAILTPRITPAATDASTTSSGSASESAGGGATKASEKYVPIRLKLSRCYEGYSLKNKDGLGGVDVVVDRENGGASNAAKQSDSCQVR